jgi:[protein-PII] uridylyltransferase
VSAATRGILISPEIHFPACRCAHAGYELTTALSKLNLNIASAHVATFGERVVDVFYVTDLTGAQITAPTRQAAIKRPLLALFAPPASEAKAAAG